MGVLLSGGDCTTSSLGSLTWPKMAVCMALAGFAGGTAACCCCMRRSSREHGVQVGRLCVLCWAYEALQLTMRFSSVRYSTI